MRRALLLVVVLGLTVGLSIAAMAGEAKYTFYFVSHIGPADPNMLWLTKSIDAIKKVLPVEVIYSAPEVFSIEKQRELLEAAIAAKPDGLIVPITDPVALEEPLRRAIAQGIPVVASNIEDPRPEPEKFLTSLMLEGMSIKLVGRWQSMCLGILPSKTSRLERSWSALAMWVTWERKEEHKA